MNAERLNYWAEVFDGKAWEYDLVGNALLQDEDFVGDIGRDAAEGLVQEYRVKAARARAVAATLRLRIR